MIIESIKALLGEELAGQVEAALKGKGKDGKDIDLVAGNDGTYVPAEKYNGAVSAKSAADTALKAAADALKAVGGTGDPAKIAEDVKTAQTKLSETDSTYKAEITRIQKNAAVRLALAGKVHDPADILALLDLEKIDVDKDGNLKSDLDAMVAPYKTSKPYLFKEEKKPDTPTVTGAKPAETNPPAGGAAAPKTLQEAVTMALQEQQKG